MGVPYSADEGNPIQDQDGGYPRVPQVSRMGYPQDWMGYPPSAEWGTWDGGYPGYPPSKTGCSTPLSKTGCGTSAVQDWMGLSLPHPGLDGVPPISKASTSYAAGGVSLAFTQEDFLDWS